MRVCVCASTHTTKNHKAKGRDERKKGEGGVVERGSINPLSIHPRSCFSLSLSLSLSPCHVARPKHSHIAIFNATQTVWYHLFFI